MPAETRGRKPHAVDTSTFTGAIGARILARRVELGLSVAAAAEAAGVSPVTWYGWESGDSMPLFRLRDLAAALRCRPRALLPACGMRAPLSVPDRISASCVRSISPAV